MTKLNPENIAAPQPDDWGSRDHVQTLVLMAASGLGIYICYLLAVPFLPALAFAMTFAVLFTPFQCWLERRLRNPSVAAFVCVFVIAISVVVPATFVGQRLAVEAVKGVAAIESTIKSGDWRRRLEGQPKLAAMADTVVEQVDLVGTLTAVAAWGSSTAGVLVKGSLLQVLSFCLTFYILFFFLRDRRKVQNALRALSPLSRVEMDQLLLRVDDTIHATVYGTLAVACVQGFLGGLMFWWLDLPTPLLWGVVMALLAVVPVLGAIVVWLPTAIYLASQGNWPHALTLALWGMLVVGTIDNLLRPILVGNRLKLHTVLAFMSVGGGLMVFGIAGLILGPVVLTITLVLLQIWRQRNEASE